LPLLRVPTRFATVAALILPRTFCLPVPPLRLLQARVTVTIITVGSSSVHGWFPLLRCCIPQFYGLMPLLAFHFTGLPGLHTAHTAFPIWFYSTTCPVSRSLLRFATRFATLAVAVCWTVLYYIPRFTGLRTFAFTHTVCVTPSHGSTVGYRWLTAVPRCRSIPAGLAGIPACVGSPYGLPAPRPLPRYVRHTTITTYAVWFCIGRAVLQHG